MKELKTQEAFETFVKESKLALIDFGALWCGPCKKLVPTIDELNEELTDISFAKVDIDVLPSVTEDFEVEGVPTLVLFKDGKEVDRKVGAMGKTALKIWLLKANSHTSE
jgi:thioredoxin 1